MENKKRKSRKLPKCIRPDEWDRLIKEVHKKKDKIALVAFLLAYGAGMRISEVLRCKKEHFRDNSIFIPESKYGVERVVPLPKGWRKDFFNYLPPPRSERTLQRKLKMYAKRAGLNPKYVFHSLRHGWATRMLESGVPINQVSLGLGHSNIATTSIYLKAAPQDLLKSYEEKF
jgi:integrase/recombinase XerD